MDSLILKDFSRVFLRLIFLTENPFSLLIFCRICLNLHLLRLRLNYRLPGPQVSLESLPYGGYRRLLEHLDYLGLSHSVLDDVNVPNGLFKRFMKELTPLFGSTRLKYFLAQSTVDLLNKYCPPSALALVIPDPAPILPVPPVFANYDSLEAYNEALKSFIRERQAIRSRDHV